MKNVSALTLRQSLGKVLDEMDRTGEPVVIRKGREPRAVLVPISEYQKRFIDRLALEKRREIGREIAELRTPAGEKRRKTRSVVDELRELRGQLG